jgi:hypothetical protein
LLLLLLPSSSSSSSHLGIPTADPSLLSGAAGSSVIHAGIAKPIPLPFGLGLIVVDGGGIVVDGGGIVIYVGPLKAYPLMSVVFAVVAPQSPSLEYEIPRCRWRSRYPCSQVPSRYRACLRRRHRTPSHHPLLLSHETDEFEG